VIKKCLAVLDNHDETLHLGTAMQMRKTMRIPVVALKMKNETKWQVIMITQTSFLPSGDGIRYRRFENEPMI